MSEQVCVCGGSKSQPNRDCERCQLIVQRDALLAACKAAEKIISRLPRRAALKEKLRAAIALTTETSE